MEEWYTTMYNYIKKRTRVRDNVHLYVFNSSPSVFDAFVTTLFAEFYMTFDLLIVFCFFLPLFLLHCWFQIEKCEVAKPTATLCFSLLYTISYNLRPKSWLGSTLKCQIDFFYCLQGSTKYSGMFGQQRKVCSDITNEKGSQGWLVQASLDIQISE